MENAAPECTSVKHRIRFFSSCTSRKVKVKVKVLEKVSALVAQSAPSCAVADFQEASVSAFHHVFHDAGVVGCRFHYAQAVMKRCNKIGLKESYGRDVDVATIVHCLLSLSLLPASDIIDAVSQIQKQVNADSAHANGLQQLIAYVLRHCICKRSIGPEGPSVRDNHNRTNNVLKSYQSGLRRRIKVSHPNLYKFLRHLYSTLYL